MEQSYPADTGHGGGVLSPGERALYVVAGLVMAAAAAKPRPNPVLNVLALGAGAYLAWRGAEGSCPVKAMLTEGHA